MSFCAALLRIALAKESSSVATDPSPATMCRALRRVGVGLAGVVTDSEPIEMATWGDKGGVAAPLPPPCAIVTIDGENSGAAGESPPAMPNATAGKGPGERDLRSSCGAEEPDAGPPGRSD